MKILLIANYYMFPDSVGSLRSRAMAKYLPLHGIDVSVLTYREQSETLSFIGNVIGVKDITRETAILPVFYGWRILQKTARALGFHRGVFERWRHNALQNADEIIARIKPDAILASYPAAEALEIGVAIAEKYGLPLISDFRDGLLYEALEVEALEQRVTRRHYEILEKKVMALSKLVLTVSEPISVYFREHYSHPNVRTFHNGYDPDDIAPDMSVELPSGTINIVHTGRISSSRFDPAKKDSVIGKLTEAILALLIFHPEMASRFRLHFVGQLTSRERQILDPLVRSGIVKLWGHQPRAKALGFQRKADVLLLITSMDQASIATGKLFEYLAANKKILALTKGTEAARIIEETGAGIIASTTDSALLSEILQHIVVHGKAAENTRSEDRIAEFSRKVQMKRLADELLKTLKPSGPWS